MLEKINKFIENLLIKIQKIFKFLNLEYRYITSKINPADISSKGLQAKEIVHNNL